MKVTNVFHDEARVTSSRRDPGIGSSRGFLSFEWTFEWIRTSRKTVCTAGLQPSLSHTMMSACSRLTALPAQFARGRTTSLTARTAKFTVQVCSMSCSGYLSLSSSRKLSTSSPPPPKIATCHATARATSAIWRQSNSLHLFFS